MSPCRGEEAPENGEMGAAAGRGWLAAEEGARGADAGEAAIGGEASVVIGEFGGLFTLMHFQPY